MSNNFSTPVSSPVASAINNVNTITLPIVNTIYKGLNVGNITVENNFVNIYLNANIGPNSSISIIKPGMNPIIYTGNINITLQLGSDLNNTQIFVGKQNIGIIINAAINETVNISNFNYKIPKPIDIKNIIILFLTIYFLINTFF